MSAPADARQRIHAHTLAQPTGTWRLPVVVQMPRRIELVVIEQRRAGVRQPHAAHRLTLLAHAGDVRQAETNAKDPEQDCPQAKSRAEVARESHETNLADPLA